MQLRTICGPGHTRDVYWRGRYKLKRLVGARTEILDKADNAEEMAKRWRQSAARIAELEELLRLALLAKSTAESSARLADGENVKLMVVAPRISLSFGGAGKVDATPSLPREQLAALLQDDLLPTYARILSKRTAKTDEEREAVESDDPATSIAFFRHLYPELCFCSILRFTGVYCTSCKCF